MFTLNKLFVKSLSNVIKVKTPFVGNFFVDNFFPMNVLQLFKRTGNQHTILRIYTHIELLLHTFLCLYFCAQISTFGKL
jgi:hypothetical protein